MIDLTVLRRRLTGRVEAGPVSNLDPPSCGPGEDGPRLTSRCHPGQPDGTSRPAPGRSGDSELSGLADQHGLVPGEARFRRGPPGAGEQPDVGFDDVAGQPRRLDTTHVAQRPPQVHPTTGRGDWHMAAGRHPRRSGTGPIGLPRPSGIEAGDGPGGHCAEAFELTMKGLHRVAVGQAQRIEPGQLVDHADERIGDIQDTRHKCSLDPRGPGMGSPSSEALLCHATRTGVRLSSSPLMKFAV